MSQTKVKSGLIDFTEGIDSFIEFSGGNSTVTGNLTVTGTLVGYTPTASLNISNWDTAYSYSQIGHLPLTGGTLTGSVSAQAGLTAGNNNTLNVNATTSRVGIGAASPVGKLHVESAGSGYGSVWSIADEVVIEGSGDTGMTIQTPNTAKGTIAFADNNTSGAYIQYNHSTDKFSIATGGSVRLTIGENLDMDGVINSTGGNSTNWNTAYGWGNHASAGYLTSFDITTQTDSKYLRSDESDTMTGSLIINGGLNVDTGTLFVDSINNRVGIGTTSPTDYKLRVVSSGAAGFRIDTSGSTFASPSINARNGTVDTIFSATSNGLEIGTWSNDAILFKTVQSTKMIITAGGDVGIGETSPNGKLDVSGGYSYLNGLRLSGTDNAATIWKNIGDMSIYPQSGKLYLGSQGTQNVVTVTSTSVGIGTTSPSAKLHVNGYIRYGTDSYYINTGYDSNGFYTDTNGSTAQTQTIRIQSNFLSGINNYNGIKIGALAIGNASEGVTIYTGGYDNNRLTITASGLVGIGTPSPGDKLHVSGGDILATNTNPLIRLSPDSGTSAFIQKLSAANGDYLRIYDGTQYGATFKNGRIGIGTDDAQATLDVVSDSGGNGIAIRTRPQNDWGWLIYDSHDSSERLAEIGVNRVGVSSGDLYFTTSGSTKMVIKSEGNVGISTTSPGAKLDVSYFGSADNTVRLVGGGGTTAGNMLLSKISDFSDSSPINLFWADHSNTNRANTLVRIHTNETAAGGYPFRITAQGSLSSPTYEALAINHIGNVGVGTISPSEKLHVNGVTRISGTTVLGDGGPYIQMVMDGARFSTGGPSTCHIKTSILKGSDTMIAFNVRGYHYSPQTVDTDIAFYCYQPVSYVYGVSIYEKSYTGWDYGLYYSSDNYVCMYVTGMTIYSGFTINWINTGLILWGDKVWALATAAVNTIDPQF